MAYALVTGAAKGIGKAIAGKLAAKGFDLLLVDIDEENLVLTQQELQSLHHKAIEILAVDLSDAQTPQKIKNWSIPWHNELKILVNNAAFGLNGPFETLSLSEQLNIVNVNVKAVVSLCHLFIPVLKKGDNTYILNIGSNSGYQPVPYLNIYASSKAFIISFTRSLRYELRNTNIHVTCVSPGSTDTNFVDRAGMGKAIRKTADKYNMTPEAVAHIAVRALFNKKAETITGLSTKLGIFLSWLAPKSLSEKFGADIFQRQD